MAQIAILGCLLAGGLAGGPARAQLYSVTRVGDMEKYNGVQGINYFPLLDFAGLWPIADGQSINASGEVAWSGATMFWDSGYLYDNGTVTSQGAIFLNLVGEGEVYSINRSGTVVGYKAEDRGDSPHGTIWDQTGLRDLTPLIGGLGVARGINDAGAIVGYLASPGNPSHYSAFLYDGTATHPLGTLPGDKDSLAYAINNVGQIVGRSGNYPPGPEPLIEPGAQGHAFLYDSSGMHDLGTLPGDDQSLAYAINDAGQVVGWSWLTGHQESEHAFLYDSTGMHDLGTLGGAASQARGVNTSGQVVGWSQTADGAYHAFVWQSGVMKNLEDLLLKGGTMYAANAINDHGQIVGQGDVGSGGGVLLLTPVTVPIAQGSAANVVFGSQPVGTTSDGQAYSISNGGEQPLQVGAVTITGPNASDFAISDDTSETLLAPGATRTITLRFTPTGDGVRSATLGIVNNDRFVQNTGVVGLTGTGTVPAATLSQSSLSFGDQLVNGPSASQTITLTNSGRAPLAINGVTVTGPDAGDFSATDLTGVTLAPNETRKLSVQFTPAARGSRSATLSITDNAPDSPQPLTLAGTGIAPIVRLSPTALTFGQEPVGLSQNRGLVLQNTGDAPLNVGSLSLQGANAGDFSLESDGVSGQTLQPGDIGFVNVQFSPTVTGGRSATLVIPSDAAGSPQLVPLAGTGTEPLLTLNADSLLFQVQPGSTAASIQTLVITNGGDAPLEVDGFTMAGPNAGSFQIVNDTGQKNLNPGASRTVQISFSAASVARVAGRAHTAAAHIASTSYSATLEIKHNDPHPGSPHSVTLTAVVGGLASGGPTLTGGSTSDNTPPAAPSGLAATLIPALNGAPAQVQLTWTTNSTNEKALAIWRQAGTGVWQRVGVVIPHTTGFADRSVSPGVTYTYRVRATTDTLASDWSNLLTVTLPAAPAAPKQLAAAVIWPSGIDLSWKSGKGNETGIAIFRKAGSGDWQRIAVVAPWVTSYRDRSTQPGTSYLYVMRAHNDHFASAWTSQVSVSMPIHGDTQPPTTP